MFEQISIEVASEMIEKEAALVVDIRDPNTFAQGHIANAVRIDNSNLQQFLQDTDKSLPVIVVCYHGKSSQSAAEIFNQQGFERSYSMEGGMCEWALTKEMVI